MTGALARRTVGVVGGLALLSRRAAARAVAAQGGTLRRGATRSTSVVVLGRRLLAQSDRDIEALVAQLRAPGRQLRSEGGFRRLLAGDAEAGALDARAVRAQSGLGDRDLAMLALFDGFEHDVGGHSFRDLILARKYAGLVAGGASWGAIVRSIHRSGPAVSLTAKSLQLDGERVYARDGEGLAELDGQMLLGLGDAPDPDEVFAAAEAAEAEGRHAVAAALYGRCLAIDPGDSVAAFNRANCLRADGREAEAEAELARALKRDAGFVEAWFNLGCLVAARGRPGAARAHLEQAVALDPAYADAVFNLATLAFEGGDAAGARRWWERYLELDRGSDWARQAERGLRYLALQARLDPAG
ncbi:MAG: tetratricopeptide repeat protein [Amaricoccus sp.]